MWIESSLGRVDALVRLPTSSESDKHPAHSFLTSLAHDKGDVAPYFIVLKDEMIGRLMSLGKLRDAPKTPREFSRAS